MRVDDTNLTGLPAAHSGRSHETREAGRDGEQRAPGPELAPGADHVELSKLAGGVSRSMGALAAERSVRVEKLTRVYASGGFQVDSTALSRAILAEMKAAAQAEPSGR